MDQGAKNLTLNFTLREQCADLRGRDRRGFRLRDLEPRDHSLLGAHVFPLPPRRRKVFGFFSYYEGLTDYKG